MAAVRTPPAAPVERPAYRDGNVLRWLLAYASSAIGDSAYFLALGWAANEIAGAGQVGLVMAAGAVPRAVLMLGGGLLADRFGLRRVVIGSDIARCLAVFAVAGTLLLGHPGVWLLVLLALVFGVVDAVFVPAVAALPPYLTGPSQLARLQGMYALGMRLGGTLGPPCAGAALALSGVPAAFVLAGGLFALSLALLATVRLRRPAPEADAGCEEGTQARRHSGAGATGRSGSGRQLREGLRYIRRHPLIGPLVTSSALVTFGSSGPFNVGVVLLGAERGWGASGAGWLIGGFSVGAGAASLLLTVARRVPRAGRVQIGALTVGAVAIAALSQTGALPVAVGLAGVCGLAFSTTGGLTAAMVQGAADPALLGRVTSVMSLASFGVGPLSFALFGAVATAYGTQTALLASAAVTALGMTVRLGSGTVRRAELPR